MSSSGRLLFAKVRLWFGVEREGEGRTVCFEGFLVIIAFLYSFTDLNHRAVDKEEFLDTIEKTLGAVSPDVFAVRLVLLLDIWLEIRERRAGEKIGNRCE